MLVKRRTERTHRPDISEQAWLFFLEDPEVVENGMPGANEYEHLELRFPQDKAFRLWAIAEEDVLREWLRDHAGSRPGYWWICSAPGPRLRLNRDGSVHPDQPANIELRWDNHGLPDSCDLDVDDGPFIFESQASYLKRLNLLSAGERRRLKPKDFEPEVMKWTGDKEGQD